MIAHLFHRISLRSPLACTLQMTSLTKQHVNIIERLNNFYCNLVIKIRLRITMHAVLPPRVLCVTKFSLREREEKFILPETQSQ